MIAACVWLPAQLLLTDILTTEKQEQDQETREWQSQCTRSRFTPTHAPIHTIIVARSWHSHHSDSARSLCCFVTFDFRRHF